MTETTHSQATTPQVTTDQDRYSHLCDAVADFTRRLVVEGTTTSDDEIGALEGLLTELIRGADTATLERLLSIHQRDLATGEYPELDNPEKGEDLEQRQTMAYQAFGLLEQVRRHAASQ
ncbi:MAG: hypothetical protein AWU57_585 [Marinobacter sp. T13-3]|nr:MAG: hypothetical protein AWU57_585 [Marinobacter sp. T13-3]